jgi:hypothetical protein
LAITLQNWPADTLSPFSEALIKKGFKVNLPTAIQQLQVQSGPFASKGTTTGLAIDYPTRRVLIQVTNNVTSPHDNLKEILAALTSIGYPPQESIERIEMQGTVTIKIEGDTKASDLVPKVIKDRFVGNLTNVFGRQVKAVGIRLETNESIFDTPKGSPFNLLLEPLFNDPSNSKLVAQLACVTDNEDTATTFLERLYQRLKLLVEELNKE